MGDATSPTRLPKPGWTLFSIIVGIFAMNVGMLVVQHWSNGHDLCIVLSFGPACARVDAYYWSGVAACGIGLITVLASVVLATRRAERARAAGLPWKLARRRDVTTLLALAVLIAAFAPASAVIALERSAHLHAYHGAQKALAALALPAGLTRKANADCTAGTPSDRLCATSALSPHELASSLEQLLHGKADEIPCATVVPSLSACAGVLIRGRIGGYPAFATVWHHLLLVKDGAPPAGAVAAWPGSKGLFYLGSDVTIGVVSPDAL